MSLTINEYAIILSSLLIITAVSLVIQWFLELLANKDDYIDYVEHVSDGDKEERR